MRSTGEIMGLSPSLGGAFVKSQLAAAQALPQSGCAFLSVRDADKPGLVAVAKTLLAEGFRLLATVGTARSLAAAGVAVETVNKVSEGRPHIADQIKNNVIDFIINTTQGEQAMADSSVIRRNALMQGVCYVTTLAGGEAATRALQHRDQLEVRSLQSLPTVTAEAQS